MTASGSGDRVVIDPDDLRRVASRMRGAAEVLSSAGRHLATRSRPVMSVGLESHVANVVYQANRELQEMALELVQTAGDLSARATQAESGAIDSIAWLIPGLHGLVSPFDLQTGSVSASGTFFEGRAVRSQEWAETALQGMAGSVEPSDEAGPDLRDFADDLSAVSFEGLGEVTPAGVALDLYVESTERHEQPDSGAARGALEVAFDQLDLGPTGIGLVGCLLAGGVGASGDSTVADL